MKIRYFKSKVNGKFYFHIRARNGRIIAASQGYKTLSNLSRTVNRIMAGGIKSATLEVQK